MTNLYLHVTWSQAVESWDAVFGVFCSEPQSGFHGRLDEAGERCHNAHDSTSLYNQRAHCIPAVHNGPYQCKSREQGRREAYPVQARPSEHARFVTESTVQKADGLSTYTR